MKMIQFIIVMAGMLCFGSNVYAQDCPDSCQYYIPNTLTPDCDRANCEILEIISDCPFKTVEFILFNRWGEEIFKSDDLKKRFDSTGHEQGVYVWRLRGEFCNGHTVDDTGHITILL